LSFEHDFGLATLVATLDELAEALDTANCGFDTGNNSVELNGPLFS
jgi:hypothetical protein